MRKRLQVRPAHTSGCSVAFAKQMFTPGALDMPRTWSNVTIASRGALAGPPGECIAMPNECRAGGGGGRGEGGFEPLKLV